MKTRCCRTTVVILQALLAGIAAQAGNSVQSPGSPVIVSQVKGLVFVDKSQDFMLTGWQQRASILPGLRCSIGTISANS